MDRHGGRLTRPGAHHGATRLTPLTPCAPASATRAAPPLTREFTVAVFVVHQDRVLLHRHKRLAMWLPPGGHIDAGELPDEAAIRETLEESGVRIRLVDGPLRLPVGHRAAPDEPARLVQPIGIQLEDIAPGHQHIDLIYAARPVTDTPDALVAEEGSSNLGWYGREEWVRLGVSREVRAWAESALSVTALQPR